ncbi:MAG: 2-hydroxyacyl-CoA dehydratase [Deltaproteobacteria bacterium]|nr:2-hydroxyacyl-CoA dehydratase [Deltaproteobacteria bacterium]
MTEQSTLAKFMPDTFKKTKIIDKFVPASLPSFVKYFLSQKVEITIPFLKLYNAFFANYKEGFDGKKKTILYPFCFPQEILRAMDLVPFNIEVMSSLASQAPMDKYPENIFKYLDSGYEKGLPGTLCSGQLGGAGALLTGDWPKPDMVLSAAPGFCDVNSKIMEFTARTLKVPLLNVELSPYNDQRAADFYKAGLYDLIKNIEELTGTRLDVDRLRETIDISNRGVELSDEITALQTVAPSPVPNDWIGLNTALRLFMNGMPEVIPVYEAILASSKKKYKKGKAAIPNEKHRMLIIYTSIYFEETFNDWLAEQGVSVIVDLLSYFPLQPIDTTNLDTMLEGISKEAMNYPMARQMKLPLDDADSWSEDMVHLAKKFKATCAYFSGNPACKRANGSIRLAADRIKNEVGIPILYTEADSWDQRVMGLPDIKESVVEFLETIS